MSESGQKVSKGSTKPLRFTTPHYFYIYNTVECACPEPFRDDIVAVLRRESLLVGLWRAEKEL
jgi:hypothetical protein